MRTKSFSAVNHYDWKTKTLSDTEIIQTLKTSLLTLNEKKYAFFNGVNKKGEMEYIYLTKDNYIAYYTTPFLGKNEISIDKLTERIKIENGTLYRWDKDDKRYKKANVVKIEQCLLCKISFFKKRLINKLKKRIIFNVSIANIEKNKIDFIKRMVYDK